MKVDIIAVGKLAKQSAENILINSYLKRLKNFSISIKEVEVKQKLPEHKLIHEESLLIQSHLSENSYKIILDITGKQLDSKQFAKHIFQLNRNIIFVIGGAFGLDPEIVRNSDFRLSLGQMTWPHMLARLLLIEQIYRANTILNNHPYHK